MNTKTVIKGKYVAMRDMHIHTTVREVKETKPKWWAATVRAVIHLAVLFLQTSA